MGGEEFREIEASLSRARKTCRCLKRISFVCMVVLLVAWAALLLLMISDIAAKGFEVPKLRNVLYVALYGGAVLSLLLVAFRSFSDVVNGESPFTMKQVARFRYAAILLLSLVAVDALLSTGFIYGFDVGGIEFAALGNHGLGLPLVHVNAIALFFAVTLYGASALFEYGVLLQRLTDETE